MADITRILLTAFEPFGGRHKNASAEALALFRDQAAMPNMSIEIQLLPVESGRAPQMLCRIIDESLPDIVLCLGEAKRDALCIETTGYNERQFTIPDNAGNRFERSPIRQDRPDSLKVTLDVGELLQAIEAAGVPVRISDDPGRYLCNEVLFSLLNHLAERRLPIRAGFIHVPHLPEYAVTDDYPSMLTSEVVRALRRVLDTLVKSRRIEALSSDRGAQSQ